MTQRKSSNFVIGVFIIAGIVLGVVALGWLGGVRKYFRTYSTYVALFNESVRGLYPSTAVAFQGIDIGSVESVDIAPDPSYAMVTMRINRPDLIRPDAVAEIDATGIAGAAFINITPVPRDEIPEPPRLAFTVHYPLIPTRPSTFTSLLSSARTIVAQLQESDMRGLVSNTNRAVRAAGDILEASQTRETLANIEAASIGLMKAVTEARTLMAGLKSKLDGAEIPRTVLATRRAVSNIDAQTSVLGAQASETLAALRESTDQLNRLLERLYVSPSDLLSSRPPLPRGGTR